MHHNLSEHKNVLFRREHYVNLCSARLLFGCDSQPAKQCLIKNCYKNGAKTQQKQRRIIYGDGVVVVGGWWMVMQKEWLQTINFHMQYILFTSHNVSL